MESFIDNQYSSLQLNPNPTNDLYLLNSMQIFEKLLRSQRALILYAVANPIKT